MNTLVVTGTRHGTTPEQHQEFFRFVMKNKPRVLRHGACKGADEDAVRAVHLSSAYPAHIIAHPGESAHGGANPWLSQQAIDLSHEVMPTRNHFQRNRDMIDAMTEQDDVLVALPGTRPLPTSGGTLYTVEYARKQKKRVVIIWSNGEVTEDGK